MNRNKTIRLLIICYLLLITLKVFADTSRIDPDQYIVKAGDIFIIKSISNNMLPDSTFVLPTGVISLFPISDTVMVAGKTLNEAYKLINDKISLSVSKNFTSDRFLIQLVGISTIRFNVLGAIARPGEIITDSLYTLHQAIHRAGGFILTSSRKINILRKGKIYEYDLNRYYAYNELFHNPFIMHDDVVLVSTCDNYIKVFTNTELENLVESIELDPDANKISDVILRTSTKYSKSTYDIFTVERDGVFYAATMDFELEPFDNLYIHAEELFVYVTGFVATPMRYQYNGSQNINYYISQSGGIIPNGHRNKIFIIRKDGTQFRYKDQVIEPGDTIYIPESFKSSVLSYLTPLATVVTLISTIVILSRN